MKKLFAILLAIFPVVTNAGLLGPSGSDDDCTKRASFAWCLLDLANRAHGIHDVSAGRIPHSNESTELSRAVDVVGGTAGAIVGVTDIVGITNISTLGAFGGVMNLLSALKSTGPESGSFPLLVAIVNRDEPKPKAFLSKGLIEATRQSLGAERFEYYAEDGGHEAVKRMGTGYYKFFGGAVCDRKNCMAYTTADSKHYGPRVRKAPVPEWYASDKNAVVMESPFPVWIEIDGTRVPNTAVALSLARFIPDDVFIYAPSNPVTKSAVLLSNKNMYFFIKPE